MAAWYAFKAQKRSRKWDADNLSRFLSCTMDEARSRAATDFATNTLSLQLLDETTVFRELVMRREVGGDTEFSGQRDHSAHTVNNWLLGWLIFETSDPFRKSFSRAVDARRLRTAKTPDESAALEHVFGDVWMFASLLHDIGYLFEGAIGPTSWQSHHEMARRAISVVRGHQQHQVWSAWGLSSLVDQNIAKLSVPSWFRSNPGNDTLVSILDELKTLGDLRLLFKDLSSTWSGIDRDFSEKAENAPTSFSSESRERLREQTDAFDLWKLHYSSFTSGTTQSAMLRHVENVRQATYALAVDGLPGLGLRLIDHGVAGGLILLQINTLFFAAHQALKEARPRDWDQSKQWLAFRGDALGATFKNEFWWAGIVWACFATAFHNVQQLLKSTKSKHSLPKTGRFCHVELSPLRLDDDPLAYLGVLVDIVQEWDRYAVVRAGHLFGKRSLQGSEVTVTYETDGRLRLNLGERATDAIEALDAALEDWQSLLVLEGGASKTSRGDGRGPANA